MIPLGGMREIGKNMYVYEYGSDMIIVDCGIAFPDESVPGIEIVIPDFTYVLENKKKLRGIFLTHCHEYHIFTVMVAYERHTGRLVGSPSIQTSGFLFAIDEAKIVKDCQKWIIAATNKAENAGKTIASILSPDRFADQLQRYLFSKTQRRPVILISFREL